MEILLYLVLLATWTLEKENGIVSLGTFFLQSSGESVPGSFQNLPKFGVVTTSQGTPLDTSNLYCSCPKFSFLSTSVAFFLLPCFAGSFLNEIVFDLN